MAENEIIDKPVTIKSGNRVYIQHTDKLEFLDQRYYYEGDFYAPSVTTILEAFPKTAQFYEWLKKVGEDANSIRDAAGEVGSKIHAATEQYDNGDALVWDDKYFNLEEWQLLCRYNDFRQRFDFKMIANEVSYCSKNLILGGTLDRVFDYNGLRYLVDLKTSNSLYDHFWLQLSAYKELWNEFNPELPIDRIAILHLKAATRTEGKKGDIQGVGWALREPDNTTDYYYDLFKATYKLWLTQNKDAKPKNLVYPNSLQRTEELFSKETIKTN